MTLPAVIPIKHGAYRVGADAVYVVLFEPVHGGGYEEAANLAAAEVKDLCSPFRAFAHKGIFVFVAGRAVKIRKAVGILGEVGGNPVHNNAYALLVHKVDEVHKVLRRAVAGGGGKISEALVAP